MDLTAILERVEAERLYQHLLRLEGVRHPIDTPQALEAAADYIHAELAGCGLHVREQTFAVDGFPGAFRNVEARAGDEATPAGVLISHYDTVWNDPGANDDGAGIALLLEAARVLAGVSAAPPVRLVAASLEEGNPAVEARLRELARQHGLRDARQRFTSHAVTRLLLEHNRLYLAARAAGLMRGPAYAEARRRLGAVPENVAAYLDALTEVYVDIDDADQVGRLNKIGSSAWLDAALGEGRRPAFALSVDEVGTVSRRPGSQTLPPGITYDMLRTYKVDAERAVGDWVLAVGHDVSQPLLDAFWRHCQHPAVDLPAAAFHFPLTFAQIAQSYPIALGSDHAPFWRAGVPALLVFDTSDWRNPFTHCPADTVDKVDVDQLVKVCRAAIATLLDADLRKELA